MFFFQKNNVFLLICNNNKFEVQTNWNESNKTKWKNKDEFIKFEKKDNLFCISRNVPPERSMTLDEGETVYTNWHEADTEVAPEATGNGNRAFLTLANSGSSFLQQQRFNSSE